MRGIFLVLLCLVTLYIPVVAQTSDLLSGTPIGSSASTSYNAISAAFDNDFSTYYKSYSSSNGWVGLDLGIDSLGNDRRCVVTRVAWVSRNGDYATLGVFEGANTSNFQDAVPLYMTPVSGSNSQWNEVEISVSRAFRYLRYVGPNGQYCRISDLRFYGYEAEGIDLLFYQPTNLPVLSIHTESGNDPTSRYTDIPASLSLVRQDGSKIFSSECTIRYRGNGSYEMPKKGYRVKLSQKHRMAGSPAKAKKWALIPSYGDKTLMRNILAFDISRRMEMAYTPFCQPIDLYVNGEYKGNYELCDQLTVDKNRVNITETKADEPIDDVTLSGGYLFEIDANFNSSHGDVGFSSARNSKKVNIKSPNDTVLTTRHINWLKQYFDKMETYIYNHNFTDQGYSQFLDFESFIRYFLINEYCSNTDAYWEMYLYKDRGDSLIHSGPIWDMDLGFDNDNRTHYCLWDNYWLYSMNTYSNWTYQGSSCYSDMRTVVGHLLSDSRITQRLAEIWAYYRASGSMSATALEEVLEEQRDLLYASQQLNFKRWNILNTQVHQNYQALGNYDKEVNYVKSFLSKRLTWMDTRANIKAAGFSFTIPDAGWTTIYRPIAFTVPEEVTLLAVMPSDDGSLLRFDTVRTAEANRPYLLHGEPGNYTIFATDKCSFSVNATDAQSLGLLVGTRNSILAPVGSYVVDTNANGQIGFQRVTASNVRLSAQTAYLQLAYSESAPDCIPLDDAQSIHEIGEESLLTGPIYVYSLSGKLLHTLPHADYSTDELRQLLGSGIFMIHDAGRVRKVSL